MNTSNVINEVFKSLKEEIADATISKAPLFDLNEIESDIHAVTLRDHAEEFIQDIKNIFADANTDMSTKTAHIRESLEFLQDIIQDSFAITTNRTVAIEKAGFKANQRRDANGRWVKDTGDTGGQTEPKATEPSATARTKEIKAKLKAAIKEETKTLTTKYSKSIKEEWQADEDRIKAGKKRGFSDEQKAALKQLRKDRDASIKQTVKDIVAKRAPDIQKAIEKEYDKKHGVPEKPKEVKATPKTNKPATEPKAIEPKNATTPKQREKDLSSGYLKLSGGEPNVRVYLDELRKETPHISREDFDKTMKHLQDKQKLVLYELDDPKERTKNRVQGGIDIAGDRAHIVYWDV